MLKRVQHTLFVQFRIPRMFIARTFEWRVRHEHVTSRFDVIFVRFKLEEIDGHFILSKGHQELKELTYFATKLIFSAVRDNSRYVW